MSRFFEVANLIGRFTSDCDATYTGEELTDELKKVSDILAEIASQYESDKFEHLYIKERLLEKIRELIATNADIKEVHDAA